MSATDTKPRRAFLSRTIAAAAATVTASIIPARASSGVEQNGGGGDWIKEVPGSHRCLFDFNRHANGMTLLHVLNYLNTYATVQKAAGQAGAVGTFYGIGPGSSIALGFNDAMWAKYALGEYHGLKDAAGKPYTRNVFHQPTKNDVHLLMQVISSPTIPMFADLMPAIGIASLQKMGTKFLMCNNALGAWIAELEARGKGKAAEIDRDLRANMLAGVTIVPAMVIAIEQAQAAGIRYNKQ